MGEIYKKMKIIFIICILIIMILNFALNMALNLVSHDSYENICKFLKCKSLRNIALTSTKYYKYTFQILKTKNFNSLANNILMNIFSFCNGKTLCNLKKIKGYGKIVKFFLTYTTMRQSVEQNGNIISFSYYRIPFPDFSQPKEIKKWDNKCQSTAITMGKFHNI
jgi:hypothetical protein